MRHNHKINHLGRKSAHRHAMLSNMATSLIVHKRIFTTVPKAKALRRFVEPLITKSKEDTTHSRRTVFSVLQNKEAVTELFQTVSQKVGDRPGGYTRIIKTGYRLGDNAPMCFIELVDFDENMLTESGTKKARTRRSRRKSANKAVAVESPAKAASKGKEEVTADQTEKAKSKSTSKKETKIGDAETKAEPDALVEETPQPEFVSPEGDTPVAENVLPEEEPSPNNSVSPEEEKVESKKEKPRAEAGEDTKS